MTNTKKCRIIMMFQKSGCGEYIFKLKPQLLSFALLGNKLITTQVCIESENILSIVRPAGYYYLTLTILGQMNQITRFLKQQFVLISKKKIIDITSLLPRILIIKISKMKKKLQKCIIKNSSHFLVTYKML